MKRSRFLALLLTGASLLAACGTDDPGAEPTAASDGTADEAEGDATDGAAVGDATEEGSADGLRLAMVLPGSIQDAEYNAAGFESLEFLEAEYGIETEYSESVAVADVERVSRDYLDQGVDIVSFHGGQFLTVALEIAPDFPDATLIVQSGGPIEDAPDNVWTIGRPYYQGYYVLGVLAAEVTETGSVAFLGGLEIPLFKSGANAFFAGAQSVDPAIELAFTFSGDQADAVINRQAAEGLIGGGADVIVTSLNDGIFGVAEAASRAEFPVLFTSASRDSNEVDPDNYLAGLVTDFDMTYGEIVEEIAAGTAGGFLNLTLGNGQFISDIYNVDDPEIIERMEAVAAEIESGELEIEDDQGDVVIPEAG